MKDSATRNYAFSWNLLGDLQLGRPNLGPMARLEVYRLMQFCFRDVLEQRLGTQGADEIFFEAGRLAGQHFYHHVLGQPQGLNEFLAQLQAALKDMNVGVLRVEQADAERGRYVVTVSEDLECSGLPDLDFEVCVYDEGFLTALFEAFTGQAHRVKEVDCWCTGDRTCRFTVEREG